MPLSHSLSALTIATLTLVLMSPGMPRPALAGEAVVLTIAGDIENSNRGKFDPLLDGFFGYHEKRFEAAFEFTITDLAALPQHQISAEGSSETWRGAVRLSGPRLKDVLAKAGAGAKPVTVFALDGYGARFDAKQLDGRDWILAHTLNGRRLGIGGRGPLWLAYESGAAPVSADEEAKWVWSVFYIEVGGQ